jgi:molybdenum-dependent DNA-binding transcriptional regulator ModE
VFVPVYDVSVVEPHADRGVGGSHTTDLRRRHLERYGARAEQMRAVFDSPSGWTATLAACVRSATE